MAKNNNLTDFVTDLADAIRAKCKTTGTINPQDFSKFVGGMPFFKFKETLDYTATPANSSALPLSYQRTYIKGVVYLTNDNGVTQIPDEGSAIVISSGFRDSTLFSLNNTIDRNEISGYWVGLPTGYSSFFVDNAGDGQSLIDTGWHIKLDIYELCIGNPDGENTKLDLNNATGGGV